MAAAAATTTDAKTITIRGRLSFPQWTAQEAFDKSQGSQYPAKSVDKAKPSFNLTLEQDQFDKLMAKIEGEFFPYCLAQEAAGEKKDVLSKAEVKALLDPIKKKDFGNQPYNTPFKEIGEKTQAYAPEAVAVVKVIGNEGKDFILKARVDDEANLKDPSEFLTKCIKPIDETVFDMYPGCYVAVTVNIYAYHNGKPPGFSLGASTAVFIADGDRFGGGVAVDEDAIFDD